MLRFQESPPPDSLRSFVHSVWTFSVAAGAPPIHRVPPDGCLSVVLARGEHGTNSILVGPRMTDLAVPVTEGARFCGVRMRPEAAGVLLRISPRDWTDRVAPLSDADRDLADQVGALSVEEALSRLLAALEPRARSAVPDDLVRSALEAMEAGELRIDSIAGMVGVSTRTLQRRFSVATGLSPKSFARIRRFRMAIANVLRPDPLPWGRVAAEHGYADQAHFVREVIAFAGEPPSALEARLARIAHVDVSP